MEGLQRETKNNIRNITGIEFSDRLGKYLGIPPLNDRANKEKFNFIVEKVWSRLTGWKAKNLNLAGRCTLIQSVLAGVPSYVMQMVWLLQATCDALNKLNRNFLWGSTIDKRRLHLINWKKVTQPKIKGGLGFRETRQANVVLLAKFGSRLACGGKYIWAQVLRNKYIKDQPFLKYETKPTNSSTWKGLIRSLNKVKHGFG